MRILILALAAILISGAAAEARVSWRGRAVITAAPGSVCAAEGDAIGETFNVLFFPSGLSDNGPDSYLTFYGPNGNAQSYKVAARPAAGKVLTGIYINTYGKFLTAPASAIQLFSTVPAAITLTTDFIDMTGRFTNWATNVGCTVTFQGAFIRRR